MVVDLFVDDVCVCQDEVACGSGVTESVLCWYRCCGFVSVLCGYFVIVVVVIVAEEGKTILLKRAMNWCGGQLHCSITIIFWINCYCVLV